MTPNRGIKPQFIIVIKITSTARDQMLINDQLQQFTFRHLIVEFKVKKFFVVG